MNLIFVDTNYWAAILNPRDQLHRQAIEVKDNLGANKLVTTELVLVEVLNYFSAFGESARLLAAGVVRDILEDPNIETVGHTHDALLNGLDLYESRPDKGYSLTDCVSMSVMRERGIKDALTHDKHFAQEGFNTLL